MGERVKSIHVQAPGWFTTVQDLGREGFGPLGISPAGAADAVALRVGNWLVGNSEGAAALEMTLLGGTFVFPEGALLAIAGAEFGATLDGEAIETWVSYEAKPGQTLQVGATRSGGRCYLCVRGGIAVPLFLGSASTHVLSGLGGLDGRALRKGDLLAIADVKDGFVQGRRIGPEAFVRLAVRKVLRVTPGPQSHWFSEQARRLFYETSYRVTEESNRMGLRLGGAALAVEAGHGDMITEGASLGAIQIPENGLPIILFVDQQTTGGYPKIANVIAADLGSVGQLRPRDEVRFEEVDWDEARRLLREQEGLLRSTELMSQ